MSRRKICRNWDLQLQVYCSQGVAKSRCVNPGFYFFENVHSDAEPRFAPPRHLKLTPYTRPNLGSFVDWNGDGKQDLIACEFEHSIRLYRDEGTGQKGAEPKFANPDGVTIIRPYSIMMISGADAVDWNRDGDIDIITGQGHAGSRLRFYERDYIEDRMNDTHPIVQVDEFQRAEPLLLDVVRRYADAMIEYGRDTHGRQKTGLLLSALDRGTLKPLELRPEPPGGVRRGDRAGLPWRRLTGANPQVDQNLLRVLYALTDVTGEDRYGKVADHEVRWFLQNAQSPVTGLLPWGEHLSWDVMLDQPISSGTEYAQEFARPWILWDRSFELAPNASKKFALGLWNHQIANHRTGAFDRHAPYNRHGPRDGKDFPRHAGFYIHTWAHAYNHTRDETFLSAIKVVLARFERKRIGPGGVMRATVGPLDIETAASMVPDSLASRLREFARVEDRLVLENLHELYGNPDGTLTFKPTWKAGYSSGVSADWAMFGLARYEQVKKKPFRDLVIAVADAYVDALPDEDVDVWPMSFSHVISAQVAAYKLTNRNVYLEQARRFAQMAVDLYFQDNPLLRASFRTDHYEAITGGDSLALSLLEVHAATHDLKVTIPLNTIDR
ncbi:MAG: FG-GAP-like repeat-containing protein [Pirellulaceae bacterium]